jgi:hypothetical protein
VSASWNPAVRSQRLEVEASRAVALALQPRLSDLNRRRLLPVIERVLRQAGEPGRQVHIHRLRVDLGEVPLGALEDELPRLLERELRRAVHAALRGEDAEARVRGRPLARARAELLERHLLHGTLPFWAPAGTSLRSLVGEMAQAEPGLLAETVRRLASHPLVLERLAAQLGDAALARLVRVLEPEHAGLVLAYVLDLRRVHRRAPLLPLSEHRFGRALWMVVQAYLLRDPGSEFNRRSFVRSLLRGMASAQGLDYAALLATLRRGLARTRRHRAARSSLPAVVGELLREAGMAEDDPADHAASASRGDADTDVDAFDPEPADAFDPELADTFDPELADAFDPELADAFDVLGDDVGDVDFVDGLGAPRDGGDPDAVDDGDPVRVDGIDADPTNAIDAESAEGSEGGGSDGTGLAAYEAAEALGYLLRNGVLPWAALLRDPAHDEARVLAALPDLALPLLNEALRTADGDERRRMTAALARGLGEDDLARLLLRVLPALEAGPFREALSAFADAAADRRGFLARVLCAGVAGEALDLEALAAQAGEMDPVPPAELAAWPAHLLRSVLTDALRAGPAREREHPTPATLLAALAAHPADARCYLRALGRRPELAAALARALPVTEHDPLLDTLYPAAAPAARALHAALSALPAPRRAPDDEVRQVLLLELMRSGEGEAPGAAFFSRVLARLFGPRLPEPVAEHLLSAADAWARPGSLPAADADAFRAAVHAARGERTAADAASVEEEAAAPVSAGPAPVPRDAVLAFLLGRRGPRVPAPAEGGRDGTQRAASALLSPDLLRHGVERMLDEAPGEVIPHLRRHSADRRVRERWVRTLSEPALARLAHLLEPHRHETLLRTAEMLNTAWQHAAPAGSSSRHERRRFWGFLLRFLARNAGADRLTDRLVAAFFADRAARCRRLSPVPDLPAVGARLLQAARRVAGTRGDARLHAALHRQRGRLLARWAADSAGAADPRASDGEAPRRPPPPRAESPRAPRRAPAFRLGAADAGHDGEPVYVANAGLVLTSVYHPHLFERLGLLVEGEDGRRRFRDAEAVSRGVHLLQYLVDGSTSTPEPALVLNKLLCGAAPATPVDASIRITEEEKATCDGLLQAVIANWPAIGGTSVPGLCETFLQREGRLVAADDGWKLTVQRRTLDVLVDQVPWGFSIVLHPWMPLPLHVSW